MITAVTVYNQRDSRWGNNQLGTVPGTTIGGFGCLISSIAMAESLFGPDQPFDPGTVNKLFIDNKGYANGNLVVWTAIPRILPNITYLGARYCEQSPAPTEELKGHLDRGGLALIEVAFKGVAFDAKGNRVNRHWLLATGHDDQGIIKADPWYGDVTNFTAKDEHGVLRYGTGNSALDILTIHYLGDATPQAPVADPPVSPVAKLPTENPVPETPAPSDMTPGKGGGLPNGVLNWREDPSKRPVAREGANGVDITTGAIVVPSIAIGTVIDVAGYFDFNGRSYARTVYSTTHDKWNGLDTVYFDAPTGQVPDGPLPVTVVPPTPVETPTATVPEPRKRLTLLELIIEWIARITAAHIKKRNS